MARYNVIDRVEAEQHNLRGGSDMMPYALVGMIGDKIDSLVCWGMKRENLQTIADRRNEDVGKVKTRMEWGPSRGDKPPVDPAMQAIASE